MRRILAIAVGLAALAAAGTVRADGLPVLGVDVGGKGVGAPDGGRYVTIPAGRDTVVARVGPDGRIFRSRLLRGPYTIPAVAYDRSAGGLSADGSTLVLIRPRVAFPRARTPLVVLDAQDLRTRAALELHGDDSVRWAQMRLEAARALGAFDEIRRWEQILDRIRELSIARRIARRRARER